MPTTTMVNMCCLIYYVLNGPSAAALMWLVQKSPGEMCSKRKEVAAELATAEQCCLESPVSDVAWKTAQIYAEEIAITAQEGRCPLNLYAFVLVWRSQCGFDTQEVEGANNLTEEHNDQLNGLIALKGKGKGKGKFGKMQEWK